MKLIAYSVHFFILIQSVFAPRTPWNQVDDAIFGGLENLSEWSDTFSHSEPHVARTPQSPSSSATLAFRPPGHPHEAHYAPGYPRTWDNVQPPAPQQWGNVQPPAPQQWGNVQPPAPLQWGHVQPPAPQQRGNVQPPATNEFYPDPHWNHIYQPHTAPQQYATHAPAPLVPFDPSPIEHWPNVEDRNPDDLTAVVYGNKGKGPLLEPAQHEEYNSNRRQATAHNPAGLIPGSEPLALSGRPLIIKYGPDKGLFPLVDKIKGMLKISRANRRYPFSRSLSQDDMPNFYSSIYDYLSSSNRLFKEIIFENRRYLISFIRPNNELKLKQLAYSTTIWEFKAEATRDTVAPSL
ncbi:hypothetical protein [Sporisorium scitamineum]|uniref:Effector family protein Eff1 n=1 Tax=Sporisorium scitamineum TaxID=49012 RepID=A0A0F7S8Y2_9BASI|nr:hypothetical protein [Sporisorium scitamineum]